MDKQPLIYSIVTFLCVLALVALAVIYYFRHDMPYFYVFTVVAAVSLVLSVRAGWKYFSDRKKKKDKEDGQKK